MRHENFALYCKLDAGKLSKKDIKDIEFHFGVSLKPDNIIDIHYDFFIDYLGDVFGRFLTLLSLLDKASIVEVNTEELKHSKSLAQELFCKLEQIEQKYARR